MVMWVTNYRDEDLFNACMNFSQVFTIYLLKEQEIENNHFIYEYEKRKRLRFYKEMIMSKFVHLKEVVNNFDGDVE